DLMKAKLSGAAYDKAAYDARVRRAVAECVQKQVETGIDIVSDGEQSKSGFFSYVRERLEGFEARLHQTRQLFAAEVAAFPEYYKKYFREAMMGGAIARSARRSSDRAPKCTSRPSTRPCAAFRRRRCATTPATGSTRARASTRRTFRMSSATCSR